MFSAINDMSNEQVNSSVYLNFQRNRKKVQPLEAEVFCKSTPMKRKNFSAEEINLLKRLIQKYRPYQIENKKTDSVNLGEKQRIWESITAEFNSHFPHGDPTSVKQLRKLWDNLKTRRKNELLRERLMDEESGMNDSKSSMYDARIKDEGNDSLDSVNMNIDYQSAVNDGPYINGGSTHNWTLPIETVIVEDEYRDVRTEENVQQSEKESFPSNRLNNSDERCNCNQTKLESELREKKLKLILREEETLYKMRKDEQQMKNEIASVQLQILKEKKIYLAKKRRLQLQILEKQFNSTESSETNGGVENKTNDCYKGSAEDDEEDDDDIMSDSPEEIPNHHT